MESPASASSGKDEEKPTRSRISRFDEFFDLRTLSTTLRRTQFKKASQSRPGKAVLKVIRKIDSRGRHVGTYVEIKSQQLFQILLDLHEGTDWWIISRVPPTVDPKIFHFSSSSLAQQLERERAKNDLDQALISDLEVAEDFIREDYGNTISEVKIQAKEGRISFGLLWALLRPSSLVFRREPFVDQDQILRVRMLDYRTTRDGVHYAYIQCDVIRDDGNSFGLAHEYIEIEEFTGLRQIRDLDLYPLDMHPEHAKVTDTAIAQARRFLHVKQILFETHGPAVWEKENSAFKTKLETFFTYGRVMIDPAAFRMYNAHCGYNKSVHTQLNRDALTDEQCAIFSPVLLGFSFGSKTWGGFAAARLGDISWSEEAFESLVLEAKQKQLVLALTKQHIAEDTKTFDDIVSGKGRGLVGLLCGGPGCGKTLTAEATAEYTRRPLYVVSAGELGTDLEEVDLRLARALELAQRWRAVLLLDEADVFLQARTTVGDISRNALVSIFLRQLEYYQGILILTTNLIAHIDPAFESRIHFCIHYPDLGRKARLDIWHTFLRKALGEERLKTIAEGDINKLSALVMNGRQIKNAVSSARSIALEANVPLSIEHVNKVVEITNDWNLAMKQAHQQGNPTQVTPAHAWSKHSVPIALLSFLAAVYSFLSSGASCDYGIPIAFLSFSAVIYGIFLVFNDGTKP